MTKMVATVAALQLVERGELDLDAPIESYRPEWADLQVLEGFDGDTPRLRPPASKATVKHLITHTSGLGYWFFSDDIVRWEAAHRNAQRARRRERRASRRRWSPTPARGTSTASTPTGSDKVVEAAAGGTLDAVIAERHHRAARHERDGVPDDRARSARIRSPVHLKGEDGTLGGRATSTCARTPSTGPAATGCTRRRATT